MLHAKKNKAFVYYFISCLLLQRIQLSLMLFVFLKKLSIQLKGGTNLHNMFRGEPVHYAQGVKLHNMLSPGTRLWLTNTRGKCKEG